MRYAMTITVVLAFASRFPRARAEVDNPAKQLQDAFIAVAEKVGPTVVTVLAGPARGKESSLYQLEREQTDVGSGVIIDSHGYILTNEHVITGAKRISVILPGGRRIRARLAGADARSDLAVLKVEQDGLPAIRIGDSSKLKTGQWAIALGNPFGLARDAKPSVTVGVISGLRRAVRQRQGNKYYGDLIQTDAAINPGNSGGPLVDIEGRLIGINVLIFSTSGGYQGIGFAIPVNRAMQIADVLKKHGKVVYGWLGIRVEDASKNLTSGGQPGARVKEVIKASPAGAAGLKAGDIIYEFNGRAVKGADELVRQVTETPAGQDVWLKLLRNDRKVSLQVRLGYRDSFGPESCTSFSWRGITIKTLSPPLAQVLGLSAQKGVVVTSLAPGSPAEKAGLRERMVISRVARGDKTTVLAVHSHEEFKDAVQKWRGAVLLFIGEKWFRVPAE